MEARRPAAVPHLPQPARRRRRRLQARLGALGFDCGRVDGIFGPRTAAALVDFQRTAGSPPTASAAPTRCARSCRVSGQTGDGPGVAAVRERRAPAATASGRWPTAGSWSGQFGGLERPRPAPWPASCASAAPGDAARRARRRGPGAGRPTSSAPTSTSGFEASAEPVAVAHYYQVPTFESVGGRALAELIVRTMRQRRGPARRPCAACACRCCARPGCRPCC